MEFSAQASFDLGEASSPAGLVMIIGVVARRLATDEAGRFRDFGLVDGPKVARCRLRLSGELGRQLAHGLPYAVVGN
jgi:hypothetical protein